MLNRTSAGPLAPLPRGGGCHDCGGGPNGAVSDDVAVSDNVDVVRMEQLRKRRARLNAITHLLSLIPHEDLTPNSLELPPRLADTGYIRPPIGEQTIGLDQY